MRSKPACGHISVFVVGNFGQRGTNIAHNHNQFCTYVC
jgi:hypothetical protein